MTVVVTQPNGQKIEGRLDRIDDFLVLLTTADGVQRRSAAAATCRRSRSAIRSSRASPAARGLHGSGHSQRDGLPGDAQMRLQTTLARGRGHRGRRRARIARGSRRRPISRGSIRRRSRSRSPDSWPTYSGDYTGRRYSALTQVEPDDGQEPDARVDGASHGGRAPPAAEAAAAGSAVAAAAAPRHRRRRRHGRVPAAAANVTVKGAILQVNDILYVTAPDNVWAMDARDGRVLWQYFWKTKGGTHIGNRGAAMWNNYLFFETPDNYLVSLDARTGKERWHVEIADFDQQYFSTMAPIVVDNHVLVGTGNDLDAPGFLQSYDPETGKRQWIFYTVPMNPGDPGLDTWPSLDAARHGGGQVWIPGSYDPETKLYIFGTGNPTPAYTRRRAARATTCSPARSWRSTWTPARWPGTSRPRRTTRTTGTRRRRRCSSTARSTASRASSSRRRRATATSSRSIASPASTS